MGQRSKPADRSVDKLPKWLKDELWIRQLAGADIRSQKPAMKGVVNLTVEVTSLENRNHEFLRQQQPVIRHRTELGTRVECGAWNYINMLSYFNILNQYIQYISIHQYIELFAKYSWQITLSNREKRPSWFETMPRKSETEGWYFCSAGTGPKGTSGQLSTISG